MSNTIFKVLVLDVPAFAALAVQQTTPVICRGASQVTFVAQATDADALSASTLECAVERHGIGAPTWYNATALGTAATGQLHGNALNGGGSEMMLRSAATGGGNHSIPVGWVRANITGHATNQIDNLKIWALVEFYGEGRPTIMDGTELLTGPSF